MHTIINKENCLVYGLPGVAILIISLVASIYIGNDFDDNSTFVCSVSFLGCNGLLWMFYLLVFQFLPLDVIELVSPKRIAVAQEEREEKQETQEIQEAQEIQVTESRKTSLPPEQETVNPKLSLTSEEYHAYCTEFEQKRQAEAQKLKVVIINYVKQVMAPFVDEENLPNLCIEIGRWFSDAAYIPNAILLKYFPDHKDRLKTVDFKHFVWNIGVRLGFENGYSGQVQAHFIKHLFPKELEDVEVQSLIRNLTSEPNKSYIKLDRPLPDSYEFHLD